MKRLLTTAALVLLTTGAGGTASRPTWRQLDWDMLRGGRHNWASISGSVALERFQNEKKLFGKHGRSLAVAVSPFVEMEYWEFNHLYEIAALDFVDQD